MSDKFCYLQIIFYLCIVLSEEQYITIAFILSIRNRQNFKSNENK